MHSRSSSPARRAGSCTRRSSPRTRASQQRPAPSEDTLSGTKSGRHACRDWPDGPERLDPDWCGAFWKINAYAPWPIWIWLNHEWAKRQLEKAGIGYEALDNGFRSCEDPRALQRICDRLGPGAVKSFFWRWVHRLPSPFTRSDLRAGYVYELAFRQFEISDTRVFDRPQAGRAFFEGVIRDHLDVGRPSRWP